MEPQIQYATTSDGVSIAFWTLGEGTPFVYMPFLMLSHTQLEWQDPERRAFYERLAQHRKLVRYDCRGTGLSDRNIADYSPDALLLDLEAVVGHLGLENFILFAPARSGLVAITYAARHPECVSHLILWGTYARAAGESTSPQLRAARTLIEEDWETYTETQAHVIYGWSAGEQARESAAFMRESITPQAAQGFIAAFSEIDVTGLLPQVRSPTLVLQRRQAAFGSVDTARVLASRIPNARLVILEGEWGSPFLGDSEAVLRTIEEFLGDAPRVDEVPEPARSLGAVTTIFFTDIVGHTEMMQRLGDAKGRAVLREHERITRETLKQHSGAEVKTDGDSFMASFSSVSSAVDCAVALQRAFEDYSESTDEPIVVRIGLNVGEPIQEDGDYFGSAVILGARIKDQAGGGEILVPEAMRHLLSGKDFLFSDRGEVALRGFKDPVRLYGVRWRD